MTWQELVRKYFPNASDEECDFILWNKTAFPMGRIETVEQQIQQYKKLLK